MRRHGGVAVLLLGLGVLPAPAQSPERIALGDRVVDTEQKFSFRMPAGATRVAEDSERRPYYYDVQPAKDAFGQIGINVALGDETVEGLIETTRKWYLSSGYRHVGTERDYDPILGTRAVLHLELDEGKNTAGYSFYFLRRGGRLFFLQMEYDRALTPLWKRVTAAVLLSFRPAGAWDVRLERPDEAEAATMSGLEVWAPKRGGSKRTRETVAGDLSAGLALAARLIGGPELESPPVVHLFRDAAPIQEVVNRGPKDTPTAIYLPEGGLLMAHAGRTRRPAKGSADRYHAALSAYLDAHVGTIWGLPPWIQTGLYEAVLAARESGGELRPDWAKSELAAWIRRNRTKAAWPLVGDIVNGTSSLSNERDRAYALALVLAIRVSEDAAIGGILARYFARLKATLEPEHALAHALDGVDLATLHTAALAVLGVE